MFLKWKDKRTVHMISTFYTYDMMEKQRRAKAVTEEVETVQKPVMIDDYNLHMGGVDKCDQLVLYYRYSNRSRKWWKRVFFHLLDLAIVNTSILYNTVAEKSLTQLDFCLSIVASLLEVHKCLVDRRHVLEFLKRMTSLCSFELLSPDIMLAH